MVVFFPISLGTIFFILFVIFSPFINLAMDMKDFFIYSSNNKPQMFLIAFVIFLVVGFISLLITKDVQIFLTVFLNGPMIAIILLYMFTDLYIQTIKEGFLWLIFAGVVHFIIYIISFAITIGIAVFSFLFNAEEYYEKKKSKFSDKFLFGSLISGIGLALQVGLYCLLF